MHDLPLDLGALRYFVAVAEHGSFTAAARAVHVSQPSLSVAVRKLEEALETRLFQRGPRGVELTATGEVLLRHARHVLGTLEAARDEVAGLEREPRGRFVIGVHASLAAYFLPGFMARFLRRNPRIEVSLWNGNSSEVERAVVEHVVHVGLVVNPEGHADCVVKPLFTDRVEPVVSAALRRRYRRRDTSALITDHPLVYVPELRQSQHVLAALASDGPTPRQHLPCSSLELVKSLVLDGVGAGILPLRVASHGVANGRLAAVGPPLPSYADTIALVRRADLLVTAAARLLLDALREHGSTMPALPAAERAD